MVTFVKTEQPSNVPAVVETQEREKYSPEAFKKYEIGEYRTRFPSETAGLTDEQLFDVALSTDDDQDDEEWKKLFSAVPRNAMLDGDALAEHAKALGALVQAHTSNAIEFVSKAKEDWQGGPFRVLWALQADFGDKLNEFAVPDLDTGNNPDIFKITKSDGKKSRKVESNFYVQFTDGTPAGQNILSRIEFTERASDAKAMKDDIPEDIMAMSPTERETHLKFLRGRRNTMRGAYKQAMRLHFKMQEIEAYPGISIDCVWEPGKSIKDAAEGRCEWPEVANTPNPIQIWVTPEEGKPIAKWEQLTIGQFLKLNAKKALQNGGTFQALIESGATKKTPGTTPPTATEGLVIKTVDRGISFITETHRWMEEITTAKDKVDIGELYKQLNAKDNDELIVSVVELRNALNVAIQETGAQAKYLKIQQGKSGLVSEVLSKNPAEKKAAA